MPEDGLPATLRDWVEDECPRSMTVFPSLLMGRFGSLAPAVFEVSKRDAGPVRVPAGEFQGVEIRVERGPAFLSYVFEKQAPYRLLLFRREDGTEYRLARSERIPYWSMHDPGGEAWLPERVR